MGTHLDLWDLTVGHPQAEHELKTMQSRIDELESNQSVLLDETWAKTKIIDRCKEVMRCNDPTNYKLIFGES